MPVTSLFVVKEKYRVINNAVISELRDSCTKTPPTNEMFSAEQLFYDEIVIKKMIAVLEDTVKVLEERLQDIKKTKDIKNAMHK